MSHVAYAHAHLNLPRDISPGAGLRQHHLCQQSRLRSPGAYLKSTYCAEHKDSVNNFVSIMECGMRIGEQDSFLLSQKWPAATFIVYGNRYNGQNTLLVNKINNRVP